VANLGARPRGHRGCCRFVAAARRAAPDADVTRPAPGRPWTWPHGWGGDACTWGGGGRAGWPRGFDPARVDPGSIPWFTFGSRISWAKAGSGGTSRTARARKPRSGLWACSAAATGRPDRRL